jgi:hypothetical protein
MKKQELTPTLQEWLDHMNKQYRWRDHGEFEITPRNISLLMLQHKLIVEKEQDQ